MGCSYGMGAAIWCDISFFRFLTLRSSNQEQGDIIRASIAGTNMVVLNTVEAATQVLQGKAHNYSDRAPIYSVGELVGWDRTAFMMNDGVELKESRRQLAQEIGSRAASARFEDMICERVRRLLIRLLNDKNGENLYRHIHTYVDYSVHFTPVSDLNQAFLHPFFSISRMATMFVANRMS
jgi:cytochrome P450